MTLRRGTQIKQSGKVRQFAPQQDQDAQDCRGKSAHVAEITQAELREFLELAAIGRRLNHLRKSITERLQAGGKVEMGGLTAEMQINLVSRPSWSRLIEVLGEEKADEIRVIMPRTPYRRLLVRDRQ